MKQKFAHKRTRKRLTYLLKQEITKSRDDLRQLSCEYIPDLFLYVTFSPFQSFFWGLNCKFVFIKNIPRFFSNDHFPLLTSLKIFDEWNLGEVITLRIDDGVYTFRTCFSNSFSNLRIFDQSFTHHDQAQFCITYLVFLQICLPLFKAHFKSGRPLLGL